MLVGVSSVLTPAFDALVAVLVELSKEVEQLLVFSRELGTRREVTESDRQVPKSLRVEGVVVILHRSTRLANVEYARLLPHGYYSARGILRTFKFPRWPKVF